jgi:hypothetical protein
LVCYKFHSFTTSKQRLTPAKHTNTHTHTDRASPREKRLPLASSFLPTLFLLPALCTYTHAPSYFFLVIERLAYFSGAVYVCVCVSVKWKEDDETGRVGKLALLRRGARRRGEA